MSLLFDVIKKAKGKEITKVSNDLHQLRVAKCKGCPELLPKGNCKLCGCFIKDKAKYADEHCPINKW